MNQPDDELARKLVGYLDEGCRDLDQPMAERLLAARKAALSRYQGEPAPAWGWATASQAIGRLADPQRPGSVPMLIAAAAGRATQSSQTISAPNALAMNRTPGRDRH